MEDIAIPGKDEEGQIFRQIVGLYDAPSYIRRARAVEESYRQLLDRCRRQRDDLLRFVHLRLATLQAQLAGDWSLLGNLVTKDGRACLEKWCAEVEISLRLPVAPTTSARALGRTLDNLRESVRRFNDRWRRFVEQIDLGPINQLREDYNKYYLLEKECALRSVRLARKDFCRLDPLRTDELLELFPCIDPM